MARKDGMMEAIISIAGQLDPSLARSIGEAQKQLGGLGSGMAAIGTAAAAATAAVTAAVVGFGTEAVKGAAEFETQMANVSTLLDGTEAQVSARIGELGDEVLAVSNSTGVATGELTDGLYQIISAVGDSDDSIRQMELAAKAAAAGGATTTDAINLLTAVTKGYGDTSGEAFQKASDLSFVTVKLGQTSFPELASSMGKVVPLAAALGVEQEELYGAFATLTGVTGSTAEVSTQMKAVLSGMMSPTKGMAEALKSLGYSNANAALESLGLQGTLEALGDTVNGDTQALAKLFSSVEAQTAILALSGAQADSFTAKTEAMYGVAGATQTAFDRQTDTLEYTVQAIKNLGKNFTTSIGREILPIVKDIAEKLLPVVQGGLERIGPKVRDIYASLQPLISAAGDFLSGIMPSLESGLAVLDEVISIGVSGIGTLISLGTGAYNTAADIFGYLEEHKTVLSVIAIMVGALTTAIALYTAWQNRAAIATGIVTTAKGIYTAVTGAATVAATAFGAVVGFLTSPITLVVLAIGAAIAAGVALYQNLDTVKATALNLWNSLCQFAAGVKNAFVEGFSGLVALVSTPINSIISLVNGAIGSINAIGFTIPDWVPGMGGETFALNIPLIPMLAKGGFTDGVSIAGEAGTEAVISFDSAYRSENLSYWAKAGHMLGVDDTLINVLDTGGSQGESVTINVKFAPQITINSTQPVEFDLMERLREEEEKLIDMLDDMLDRRGGDRYGPSFG